MAQNIEDRVFSSFSYANGKEAPEFQNAARERYQLVC